MKVLPRPPSLQEERHQLQLHPPPVAGDSSTLRLRDSKSRPGSVTPTMRVSLSVELVHIMYSTKRSLLPARRARWAEASSCLCSTRPSNVSLHPVDTLRPSHCTLLHNIWPTKTQTCVKRFFEVNIPPLTNKFNKSDISSLLWMIS